MDLLDAIQRRHTTNGPFADQPIDPAHKHLLLAMAARAPSHFNSQPWRFIVVEEPERRRALAEVAGASMRQLMEDGRFWQQYRHYFRFSEAEAEATRDGIHFDNMPAVLKPFVRYLFTERGASMMNSFQVPRVLGNDARRLVAGSPMLLGIALARDIYQPGELTGLYSLISLGAVVQTIWLTATSLGMGMQFVSTPQELPPQWALVGALLGVPPEFELLLLLRLGYEETNARRPTIDWTSPQRKGIEELAFQEEWGRPLAR
ncbi:MAG TPA: nitroreductase family protein [Roseiflexaceae bacterium]|nr:nitroreductase family protein [Roseiflexaceae bacterium]HMP41209.1 nitroreductase family protein [Roseiflexaceae bacterium]